MLERADADWLFRLAQENDHYLTRGGIEGSQLYGNRTLLAICLDAQVPNVRRYAIQHRDEMVGEMTAYTDRPDNSVEVGYWVSRHHRGMGIATRVLGLLIEPLSLEQPRIKAEVYPGNRPSIGVLERNGFTEDKNTKRCNGMSTYRHDRSHQ